MLRVSLFARNFSAGSNIGKCIHMELNAGRPFFALVVAGLLAPYGLAPAQVPEWQIAAGGKMAFEVASVKPSPKGEFRSPNFPLDTGNAFINLQTGELPRGRFSARFPVISYINFAYKFRPTPEQRRAMVAHLPKWVTDDSFDIEARAPMSSATKDQMRLMMQSLLAERFHLATHFETQTVPVLALVLAKPGKLGANLAPHEKGPPCNAAPRNDKDDAFPPACDIYAIRIRPNGIRLAEARNTSMGELASAIPTFGEETRPVIDRTAISGRFDFKLEWIHETNGAAPAAGPTPAADSQPTGPTFLEALNDQLGLKLEATKAPVPVLVIDHVERPSEN
jgi:uncharacterized protein (TIGR03435 family)